VDGAAGAGDEPARPALRVVRGDPTPEELAAVVAVVAAAAAAGDGGQPEEPARTWAAYWRGLRRPMQPGPGAWQRSTWPH
jgi:hypothetical protein